MVAFSDAANEHHGMRPFYATVLLVFWLTPGVLPAAELARAAAGYICKQARANESKSVAVFPFTDGENEETSATRKMTTRVIAGLSACDLAVIDQSKIKDVLREQVRRQSGLYDEDTLPAIGRLAGASVLVYGTDDGTSLQIRLVDAASGKVLGATVKEGGTEATGSQTAAGSVTTASAVSDNDSADVVHVYPVSANQARESLESESLNDWLVELENQDPELFLYVSSSRDEFNTFADEHPEQAGQVLDRIESLSPANISKLNRMKKKVRRVRVRSPAAGKKLRRLRKTAVRRARRNRASAASGNPRKPGSHVQRLRRTGPEAGRRVQKAGQRQGQGRQSTRAPARNSRRNQAADRARRTDGPRAGNRPAGKQRAARKRIKRTSGGREGGRQGGSSRRRR